MAKTKNAGKRGSRKRRGSGEDMTESKANEVEMRTGELALAPIQIDDKDFDVHYKAIKAATDKKETAMALLRTCKKNAKAAGQDVLDAVNLAMSLERQDVDEVKRKVQLMGYTLKKIDSPYQIAMYDQLAGDVHDQAYKRGKVDGEAGKMADCPYPEGTDLADDYSRGWQDVQNARVNGFEGDDVDASLPLQAAEPEPQPLHH